MEVKEIKVSFGKTKNIGNYESLRSDAEVTVVIQENDNTDEMFKKAYEKVKLQVAKSLDEDYEQLEGNVPF